MSWRIGAPLAAQDVVDRRLTDADVHDFDVFNRLFLPDLRVLNHMHDVHSFDASAEDCVFVVQPGSAFGCDEELTSIRTWSGIGHADRVWLVVSEFRSELILELLAPDGFATSSVSKRVPCEMLVFA